MLFRILGPIELHTPAVVHQLGAGKPAAVLATLVQQPNAWVTVDQLAEATWPGAAMPVSAGANLKTYVWQLRRLLPDLDGAGRITHRADAYRLRVAPGEIDADRARSLAAAARTAAPHAAADLVREALALWRGRPYCGVESAAAAADVLDQLRLELGEQLAALRLELGDTAEAIGTLHGVVAEAPLREPAWALLVHALHAAGRRTEALLASRRAAAILRAELGVGPGPQLTAATRQAEAAPSSPYPAASAAASPTHPAPSRTGPSTTSSPGHVSAPSSAYVSAPSPARSSAPPPTRLSAPPPTRSSALSPARSSALSPARSSAPSPARSSAPSPARRELPRDVRLVGRAAELAHIRDVAAGPTPIVLLSGPAGIGKTTLAVHAAHQLAPDHPDGQFFIHMRRPAGALLDRLLRGIGLNPRDIPSDLDERAALWRSEVSRRRVLLVLDDAQTRDQVWPLLPATSGSTTLVTARCLTGDLDGATHLPLPPLSPAATRLLTTTATAHPAIRRPGPPTLRNAPTSPALHRRTAV